MSGGLIGGVIGGVIGFFVGGPTGAMYGFEIGAAAGGMLFPGKLPDQFGPRLNDLKVQISTYGTAIPIVYGHARLSGNVIWSTDLIEHSNTEDQGGKGGPTQSVTTYTYSISAAVAVCEGPIIGIRRIWANSKLIFDNSVSNTGPIVIPWLDAIQFTTTNSDINSTNFRVYLGDETQMPDPTIEAYLGAGNVSANRGVAYVVFTDFPLEKFGNQLPNFSFEVVASGGKTDVIDYFRNSPLELDGAVYVPLTNEIWVDNYQNVITDPNISRINTQTGAVNGTISIGAFTNFYTPLIYDDGSNGDPFQPALKPAVWTYQGTKLYKFDIGTGSELFQVTQGDNQGIMISPFDASVWIKNTSGLTKIDRENGNTLASYFVGFNIYDAAFASDGGIWLTSITTADVKNLYRFDPSSGGVDLVYTNSTNLTNIAYDSLRNDLWIAQNSATLLGFNVNSKTVVGSMTLAVSPAGQTGTLVYDPYRDVIWSSHFSTNSISGSNVSDGSVYKTFTTIASSPTTLVPTANALYGVGVNPTTGDNELFRIMFDRITLGSAVLSDVLTDISTRTTQLNAGDIDVSAQTSISVDGYVISRQTSGRSIIEQLQQAYFFDMVESDDKVKFVNRGSGSAVTIPDDDLAAFEAAQTPPDDLATTREMESTLPQALNLNYMAETADYQTGTQQSRRLVGATGDLQTFDMPIVLTDDKAKQIVDAAMYAMWTARTTYKFTTTMKYAKYEPTDVVTVKGKLMRLTKRTDNNGVISWEAVAEEGQTYTQTATGITTAFTPQTVSNLVATNIELLDIPMLRDADNDAGFYVAANGWQTGWPGCVLFKSVDGGASYSEVSAITTAAPVGSATSVLADWAGGNRFDTANTVTVKLIGDGTLSSASELAIYNGTNGALLGNEIIQYTTATLNGDGSYTLSGLLRGRQGTEWAMPSHSVGDRFVALNTSSLQRVSAQTSEIGLARLYKAVTIGSTLAATNALSFTNTAIGLKPYAPVQLTGSRDGSNNLTINWIRRTRVGGAWLDRVDVPIGETSELYDVEIWDSTYSTLKRTFSSLTSATASYTAAQQTTDFGSVQNPVYCRVYQLSATVGRGTKLEGNV